MAKERKLLALDFGGTKLSAALAAAPRRRGRKTTPGAELAQREWLDLRRAPSPKGASAGTDMEIMRGLARDLLKGEAPAATGISFGGPVAADRGWVLLSHHVPGWENTPLAEQWQSELGAPVSLDNDANAAALGEWRFGAGQGCDSLLYVTVSTGVGGGWILNGRIWRGADSMAGEIGHTVVQPDGPPCICGKCGCVEALAAGPNLARRAREYLEADKTGGRILRELAGEVSAVTAEQVARAANAGDELAWLVLAGAARALGLGLGTAMTLMNPQRVVLGGGVTKSGERYWQLVRETAQAVVLPGMRAEIVPAGLADDAPLWGAVALAEDLLS